MFSIILYDARECVSVSEANFDNLRNIHNYNKCEVFLASIEMFLAFLKK